MTIECPQCHGVGNYAVDDDAEFVECPMCNSTGVVDNHELDDYTYGDDIRPDD